MATDQIKALAIETDRLENEVADKLATLENLLIKQLHFLKQQISITQERSAFIRQEILREQKELANDRDKFNKQKTDK